ncbi:MAG: DUF2867 domain-containing protein [Polyangiaceae bacterium]
MTTIGTSTAISNDSIILVGLSTPINYVDRFDVVVPAHDQSRRAYSLDFLTGLLFTSIPKWAHALFVLRDRIGVLVGLKSDDWSLPSVVPRDVHYRVGSKAVFFHVNHRTDDEIVMAETDRHLDFRASVRRTMNGVNELTLSVTTVVCFNNGWGRWYFTLIRPFHVLILRSLLQRLALRLRR